jgi:hypothetical protein
MLTGLFAKLIAFPMIGKVLGFFKSKHRLVIEYVLIALLLATAGFTLSMWLSKGRTEKALTTVQTELTRAKSRLNSVEQINQAQQATIKDLRDLRAKDALALTGLADDMARLGLRDQDMRRQISELEKSNATVSEYLNQPIPTELKRLLEHAGTGTGNPRRN